MNDAEAMPEPVAAPLVSAGQSADEADPARVDTAQLLQLGRAEAIEPEAIPRTIPYAVISILLGVIGAIGGLFVLWMVPFSLGAIVFAWLARRDGQRGTPARLGVVTGLVGLAFGGVWVLYALGALIV
ncbi:MAG TPA: hypothetical protein VK139_05360 [Microbacteriaceae bacterium]|nr:hypothetical protein [Microbacteriaceae bacterium]